MKKVYKVFFLLLFVALGCIGCSGENGNDDSTFKIYYLNNDITGLVPIEYVLEDGSLNSKIEEVMDLVKADPESIDCKRAFTDDIEILSYRLEKNQLVITFNEAYLGMDVTREVLCRASIVKTVTQLVGIDYVVFNVGDAPLTDFKGNPVGLMTKEDFIESTNDQMNSIQTATLTLYFGNEVGDQLVEEIQKVHYSSNMSMEKLVVEQLIAGPNIEDARQTISPDTKLLSISQKDGVCYVDFDKGFLEKVDGVSEEVTIYSLVNSLSEVQNINKIQISIDGETDISLNENLQLNTLFERNLDIIQSEESIEEVELPEEETKVENNGTEVTIPDE